MSQPLLAGLKSVLTKLKVGNPMLSDVFMGPLATKKSKINFNNYLEQLKDEGGRLVSEDPVKVEKGAFVSPSFLRLPAKNRS